MGGGASTDKQSVQITPAKSPGATQVARGDERQTPSGKTVPRGEGEEPTAPSMIDSSAAAEDNGDPSSAAASWEMATASGDWQLLNGDAIERLEEAYKKFVSSSGKESTTSTTTTRFVIGRQLYTADLVSMNVIPGNHKLRRQGPTQQHQDSPSSSLTSHPNQGSASSSPNNNNTKRPTVTATLASTIKAHDALVYCASFSLDGGRVLTGSRDSTARLWELDTGSVVTNFAGIEEGTVVLSCALAPTKAVCAIGMDDAKINMYNTSKPDGITLNGHERKVYGLAFTSDSKTVCSGAMDQDVRCWDVATGKCFRVISKHLSSVFCVTCSSFSPNLFISGGDDNVLIRHDLRGLQPAAIMHGHSQTVWSASIRYDDGLFLSGAMDGIVNMWDPRKLDTPLCKVGDHGDFPVHSVEFLPDGSRFLTSARDSTWRMWAIDPEVQQVGDDAAAAVSAANLQSGSTASNATPHNGGRRGSDVREEEEGGDDDRYNSGSSSAEATPPPRSLFGQRPMVKADGTPIVPVRAPPPPRPRRESSTLLQQMFLPKPVKQYQLVKMNAHKGNVFKVTYSAARNQVLSCGSDAEIKLWDLTWA